MNYYEKELIRLRRNFDFSLKIYSRRILLQQTLCIEMMEKVDKLLIPRQFPLLIDLQEELYQDIQSVYVQLILAKQENKEER
ncbi:hypothetical protein EFN92_03665 [Lactococcus lactis]|uniref:hypothetical protein n=1 Tax=Lactococcus lactis TaxID=1358 RepID=UPI0021A59F24|nr:hypothetical protein [Lactococcus lactis]MCT3091776.1 hypothetical protein [Lactococcus lactis]